MSTGIDILAAQMDALTLNLKRVEAMFQKEIATEYQRPVYGKFNRAISPHKVHLEQLGQWIKAADLTQGQLAQAWTDFAGIQLQAQKIFEQCLDYWGGITVRQWGLEGDICALANKLVVNCVERTGINWSSVIIPGEARMVDDVAQKTKILRIPVPRWDLWILPLIIHDFAYLALTENEFELLNQFIKEQTSLIKHLLDEKGPSEAQIALLLPEIQQIREISRNAGNRAESLEKLQPALERLVGLQKRHLWSLLADAFAAYLLGPAYAYALLFLALDPTHPYLEGEMAEKAGTGHNVDQPADARRMAMVLHILQAMNERGQADRYSEGPFTDDLRLLEEVWQSALITSGNQEGYGSLKTALKEWGQHIFEGLEYHFGSIGLETTRFWNRAKEDLIPVLLNGSHTPLPSDLPLVQLISAAWWCRARYPNLTAYLSEDCQRILQGRYAPLGLKANRFDTQDHTTRLFLSRLYDLQIDLQRLTGLISSEKIEQADRNTVAGRFYRLISEQDWRLKKLQNLSKLGSPLSATFPEVIQFSQGSEMQALRREVLDFLGGVLVRSANLEDGIYTLAETLLRDYVRFTGVNWASRVIPGNDPLFSPASEMIHLHFPTDGIWDLPLLAHEFGHVTAMATPAFQSLWASEFATLAQGHPEANAWDNDQKQAYLQQRGYHLHEFFADAFAVYCQGPAFAYTAIWLHFNPQEAYALRGNHPTHAERVEVILAVLEQMNQQGKQDNFDPGFYLSVISRIKELWSKSIQAGGSLPGIAFPFLRLQARSLAVKIYNLLDKYYRLGAGYPVEDWKRANTLSQSLLDGTPDLSVEGMRNLLNTAWICREYNPQHLAQIDRVIRTACTHRS